MHFYVFMQYNTLMSKVKIVFILGIWVAILPFLGFPYSLKNIIYNITGLIIIFISYLLYKDLKVGETTEEKTFDNFSENNNFNEVETPTIEENEETV